MVSLIVGLAVNSFFNISLFLDLYATVGCHPSRTLEFDRDPRGPEGYLRSLETLVKNNPERAVAIGVCGIGI